MNAGTPPEKAPKTKILRNGAVYDLERKRIVAVKPELAEVDTRITAETGRLMQAQAVAKKRLVMMQAANAEVPAELIAQYGDYAHVAERAQTLQRIASSPEAGKAAVMAHQALTSDTGMAEPKQAEQAAAPAADADTVRAMVAFAQFIERLVQQRDAVSGDVVG